VVAVVIAGLLFVPVGTTKSASSYGKVIWEKETEYQYARVIQRQDGERLLELNEGLAVHSVYTPGQWLTGGYWDDMTVLPFAADHRPRKIAILGSAAGTTARAIAHYAPDVHVDAVELDPDITEVGRKLFDLRGRQISTHTADARPWLDDQLDHYDAILVDAYRQPYIPFYLATKEFFTEVRDHLNPGGVVAINVGHPETSRKLEQVLTATVASAFGGRDHVLRDRVDETNTMLLGTTGPAGVDDAKVHLYEAGLPPEPQAVADQVAGKLAPGYRGGTVYTDDKAPVEWLVDLSLAQVAK
jgi:spermidine synthase